MDPAWFCNPFDAALAEAGPPAVFLFDREGLLRFDDSWTRDAWVRQPGPTRAGASWRLLRDRDTGYVVVVLVSSPDLLLTHARADVRAYPDRQAALGALAAYGHPPLSTEGW